MKIMAILVLNDSGTGIDREFNKIFMLQYQKNLLVYRIFKVCAPKFGTGSGMDIVDIL